MKLIAEWRHAWRFWSVRFTAIGAAVWSFLLAFPGYALDAWAMVPPDIRMYVPEGLSRALPLIFFGLALVSRVVRQDTIPGRLPVDPAGVPPVDPGVGQ